MPAKMKIRSAYSSLPSAERKVADFILQNPERASLMVINEIAEASNVSVPSVTRLAKKLGYKGFLDFRVALASGNSSLESLKSDPVSAADSDNVVIDKVFLSYMRAIEDTLKALDRQKLSEFAEHILNARRIFVFGTSISAMLAKDLVMHLNLSGYDAIDVNDPVVMELYAKRFTPNDVFLGISRSGRTRLLLDSLKAAKQRGAYCAFISNYVNSPAAALADAFFCTSRVDDVKSIVGRETNVSMYTFVGALLVLLARKKPEFSLED